MKKYKIVFLPPLFYVNCIVIDLFKIMIHRISTVTLKLKLSILNHRISNTVKGGDFGAEILDTRGRLDC